MSETKNPNRNAELSEEANTNMLDSVINNLPLPLVLESQVKPLDRVMLPTEKKHSRELER